MDIDHEPSNILWVLHVLKKCDAIIVLPKTVEDSSASDEQNYKTMWVDAIIKEMKNVCVLLNIIKDGSQLPRWYKFEFHTIFDVVTFASFCLDGV